MLLHARSLIDSQRPDCCLDCTQATWRFKLVRPTGFEPVTFGFGGQHSIQLSYGRVEHSHGAVGRPGRLGSLVLAMGRAQPFGAFHFLIGRGRSGSLSFPREC